MNAPKQTEMNFDRNYKPLYLVGINDIGGQELIMFRYRETSIPLLQYIHNTINLEGKVVQVFSDINVEHSDKYIQGGVPNLMGYNPSFTFNRETLELKFFFNDRPMSCVILEDTAIPFVKLIARM